MNVSRAVIGVCAASLSVALLSSCGSAEPGEGDADEVTTDLVEAAIQEGQLTIYASTGESQIEAIVEGFREAYPEISTEYFRAAGTALFNRFASEAEAGAVMADVFMPNVQPSFVQDNSEWFSELTPELVPNSEAWPEEFRTDHTVQVTVESILLVYNTETVDQPPETWPDVLDERYRGRVVLVDPNASPGYMSWYSVIRDQFGDEFLEALADLDPMWVDTAAVGAQQVATGGSDLAFPNYPSQTASLQASGAPIETVTDLDPTQGITTDVAITADAPNPNAARLFVDWLISEEGYEVMCEDPVFSATVEVEADCVELASNHISPRWEIPDDEQQEILSLLGR